MIINNTDHLEQIYESVKDMPDVESEKDIALYDIRVLNQNTCNNVSSIRKHAFNSTYLHTADFPNATSIGEYAFHDCAYLSSINFPNVISIGSYAFYMYDTHYNNLTSINLPSAISIGSGAFRQNKFVTTVDLPSITSIGNGAFSYCTSLITFILRSNTLCTLEGTIFYNTPINSGTGYIYVPRALIEDYKVANYWSTYASQFRAIEDYTIDGTTTGELDPDKI